jgi:DNA-directed RNA polymerase subunit RPC12/RpoP
MRDRTAGSTVDLTNMLMLLPDPGGVPRKTIREQHMSTTEVASASTLADLSVLVSYASWRGFVLHSLVIVAVYRCAVCGRSTDSAMVATKDNNEEVICPRCFTHLVRTCA